MIHFHIKDIPYQLPTLFFLHNYKTTTKQEQNVVGIFELQTPFLVSDTKIIR